MLSVAGALDAASFVLVMSGALLSSADRDQHACSSGSPPMVSILCSPRLLFAAGLNFAAIALFMRATTPPALLLSLAGAVVLWMTTVASIAHACLRSRGTSADTPAGAPQAGQASKRKTTP